jgi:hypothetical protein
LYDQFIRISGSDGHCLNGMIHLRMVGSDRLA